MRARRTLTPGQKGTKKLLRQYGSQLVCVRYRYGAERRLRFKTVELIIEQAPWSPTPTRIAGATLVGVRVGVKRERGRTATTGQAGRRKVEPRRARLADSIEPGAMGAICFDGATQRPW
jgi:hypothetical protein